MVIGWSVGVLASRAMVWRGTMLHPVLESRGGGTMMRVLRPTGCAPPPTLGPSLSLGMTDVRCVCVSLSLWRQPGDGRVYVPLSLL